ncbi:MAG: serine hydrolase [Leptospiraceae bacterium]|nr:serine hydrolase [Leptospiraceae bacterium]
MRIRLKLFIVLIILNLCKTDTAIEKYNSSFLKKTGNVDETKVSQIKQSLENWLTYNYSKKIFPSVAVGVVKGSELIYSYKLGTTEKTNFGLGSITKTFTGTMVMQAIEKGLIELDAPANKYLSGLKLEKEELKSKPVTIRHLLSHTSGMPDLRYYQNPELHPAATTGLPFNITGQIYPAGYHYRYSNHGFMTLGVILEKVYNKPLKQIIEEEIFAKIGMENSFASPMVQGAGGIQTNLIDMGRYASMWLNEGKSVNGIQVLKPATVNKMIQLQTPIPKFARTKKYCGLAWRTECDEEGVTTFFHIGGANYVAAWVQMFPKYDIAVFYLSNPPEYDDNLMTQLVIMQWKLGDLASAIVGAEKGVHKTGETIPTEEIYKKYEGIYKNPLTQKKASVLYKDNKLFFKMDGGGQVLLPPSTINVFGGPGGPGSYEFTWHPLTQTILGVSNYSGFYERIYE